MINEFGIITVLTLFVNMESHLDYSCEVYDEDSGFCSERVFIQFEGMFVARKQLYQSISRSYDIWLLI